MIKQAICFLTISCLSLFSLQAAKFEKEIRQNMPGAVKDAKKKYKLMVYSKASGFRHKSIPTGRLMIDIMAEKTGLFTVTHNDTPQAFEKEYLAQFDAILFNNSTHIQKALKENRLRENLINYVKNGGGIFCIHSATDGGWKEYTEMINGNFDGHPWGAGGHWDVCNEDHNHPVMKHFPKDGINIKDELYQYKDFDRKKVRVLAAINMESPKNKKKRGKRKDNDYALLWVRQFGEGRVFVSSLGHNDSVFFNQVVLKTWLEGLRYVFKDIDAPSSSIPKPKHTFKRKQDPRVAYRSIEQSMKEFELQPGYSLEIVASDPMVIEPALTVFDGNGRMYVAEFRTYMQDADGSGKFDRKSQVVRLEDTNGDGKMDKRTVFIKNMILPRIILPLDDRVIVGETNTTDLYVYRDTNGDGQADEKKLWFKGGPRRNNLEHQPSGLIWSIDNWLYTTYNNYRLRYSKGGSIKAPTMGNGGQWGLTQDNSGKVIYVNAGGERGPVHFQFPTVYHRFQPRWEQSNGYRTVFPIDNIPDTQGGRKRLRRNNTLNHFTATCGQEVFRGDRLPKELVGNLFFSEPVGRLIRRTEFKKDEHGRIIAHNAHQNTEFIRTTDPNFRVVNMVTAPDGTMYLTDMYRGIIQEGAWVRPGSYLRGVVDEMGLDMNIGKGRIYRLRHKDFKPGPQPRMLDETPKQWVQHLAHPNGWWRDTAQKLLVLKGDQSVVADLIKMTRSHSNELARLHALWTLEGLGALKRDLIEEKLVDQSPVVRAAAIRNSEPHLENNPEGLQRIMALAKDPSVDVKKQLALSLNYVNTDKTQEAFGQLVSLNPNNTYLKELRQVLQRSANQRRQHKAKLAKMNDQKRKLMKKGEGIYKQVCLACHGADGKGIQAGPMKMAPSFVKNKRVLGKPSVPTNVILHGLTGPIEGKQYAANIMIPMKQNDDAYIASVLTYIRNTWGNKASMVTEAEVAKIRKASKDRKTPYTFADLKKIK